MAHTDKDEPYWVTRAMSVLIDHDHRHGHCVVETLDDTKVARRHWPAVWRYPFGGYAGPPDRITCTRAHPNEGPRIWYGPCPNWYVSVRFHNPERRRTRDALADAKKWRIADLEDFDLPERKAKHGCTWDWQ